MNEQLPYEDEIIQKLEALSLPDENAAWKDMRRRLDEKDDDDGVIIPSLKGCGLFAVIGIALLLISSILFWNKIFKHQNINTKNYAGKQIEEQKSFNKNNFNKTGVVDSILKNHDTSNAFKNKVANDIDTSKSNSYQQLKVIKNKSLLSRQHESSSEINGNRIVENKNIVQRQKRKVTPNKIANKTINNDTSAIEQNYNKHTDSSASFNDSNIVTTPQPDTAAKKITAQQKQDSSNNKKQKETSQKQHKNSFTAGFTEHQQIPFGGQTFIPFNAEGFGGLLLNYIPSVFLKVYDKQKFFLQLELRYSAPQLTKPANLYKYTLKKIYYHQLPLSLHYNFNSHLSAGTGIILNRFSSAVAEDTINRDTAKFLKIKSDSSFTPTYLQGMFETEYKWKKLSLGFIYEQGLQPFLRKEYFVNSSQKKNPTLQIFLRYEMWRSKKK